MLKLTCPWHPGMVKAFWAPLARAFGPYPTSRCRYVDASTDGRVLQPLLLSPGWFCMIWWCIVEAIITIVVITCLTINFALFITSKGFNWLRDCLQTQRYELKHGKYEQIKVKVTHTQCCISVCILVKLMAYFDK